MNKKTASLKLKSYQQCFLFCFINVFSLQMAYAKIHHPQNTPTKKIILSPQPNNNLLTVAHNLNKTDLNFAIQHGEKPLVLIGSANLSNTRKPQTVLFIQLQSASLCGSGGCTTTAYLKRNTQWIKILDSVTGNIEVKKTAHHGMHDLVVEGSDVWIWNNNTYHETQQGPQLNGLKNSIQNYQDHK